MLRESLTFWLVDHFAWFLCKNDHWVGLSCLFSFLDDSCWGIPVLSVAKRSALVFWLSKQRQLSMNWKRFSLHMSLNNSMPVPSFLHESPTSVWDDLRMPAKYKPPKIAISSLFLFRHMCHGQPALHPNWLVCFPLFFGLSSVRLHVSYFLIQIDSNILSQFLLVAHCPWLFLFSNEVAQSADVDEMGDNTMQFDYRLQNAHTMMVDELTVVEEFRWLWNLCRWNRLVVHLHRQCCHLEQNFVPCASSLSSMSIMYPLSFTFSFTSSSGISHLVNADDHCFVLHRQVLLDCPF